MAGGGYKQEAVPAMDEAPLGEEDSPTEVPDGEATGAKEADDVLPDLTDLIDAAEEAGTDVAALTAVIRDIGRRLRLTPGDRDFMCDFEGNANICKALSEAPHNWQGDAMLAFCKIMPDLCRTSSVNRGSLRDEGFLVAAVDLLRTAVTDGNDNAAIAACTAVSALCTASDGNKKVAAQLEESTPEKPGAMLLCLSALGRFQDSVALQIEAISALRSLMTDDDSRKADCEPSALQNREVALSDGGFPLLGIAVEQGFQAAEASAKPQLRLLEETLLLLREMARRQEYVPQLAFKAKLLPKVQAALLVDDARVVRASLSVLRAFCIVEEVRDEVGILSDGALECIVAVGKHIATPVVCEQGFGLFMNLTLRKSSIAAKLNEGEHGIVALGQQVLRLHSARPEAMRSTVATLRNVATQDEAACAEVKESDIFELVRALVQAHEGDKRWNPAVDISRQFLREYRMDEGMLKKALYNKFY